MLRLLTVTLTFQPLESDMLALNIRKVGPGSKYNIHEIPSVDGKQALHSSQFLRSLYWAKKRFTRGYLYISNSKQHCGGLPIMS